MSKTQEQLIGKHPDSPNFFADWFSCEDKPSVTGKKHRSLKEHDQMREEAIEWLSNKIISHHISEKRIDFFKRKLQLLGELGFEEWVNKQATIPKNIDVKKGNSVEVMLTEYIKGSTQKEDLLTIFKFRFNPNIEQAIKGDDTLLFDFEDPSNIKIYLGEAKFRSSAKSTVVKEIAKSLSKDRAPLSLNFVCEELWKIGQDSVAEIIQDIDIELIKKDEGLICVGMLLSDENAEKMVDKHLNCSNDQMVFVSIGINTPFDLVEKAFQKANEKILKLEEL